MGRAGKCRGPNILVICGPHRRCKVCIDPAVVHQGRLSPGEWIVVHGCGGVGLSAIMITHAMGAQVISVDNNQEALKAATSFGAAHVFNRKTDADLIPTMREVTGGGAHVAVDRLGISETCVHALMSLRKKGRHVQVGMPSEPTVTRPIVYAILSELEIIGCLGMQAHAYPRMLDLVRSGNLRLLDLFGRVDAKAVLETERLFARVVREQVGGEQIET